MKNPNQAKNKTAKKTPSAPSQKHLGQLPLDPFGDAKSFKVILDNIGDTMEPEVFAGDGAIVEKEKNLKPRSGDMVVGHLDTGKLIFGILHILQSGLYQIRCINPKNTKARPRYAPGRFHWLYPVHHIEMKDAPRRIQHYTRLQKAGISS